jgi:hypothetical protein
MTAAPKLVKYEAARVALAEARRVDEAKDIRDKSIALAAYARQAQDRDMIVWATEIKVRAERRTGELLRETAKQAGARGTGSNQHRKVESLRDDSTKPPSLESLGVTKQQSSDWQKLAAIPEREFERRIAEAKKDPATMTTERILRGAPPKMADPFDDERRVWAPEIKVRAERRTGELLRETARAGQRNTGGKPGARNPGLPTRVRLVEPRYVFAILKGAIEDGLAVAWSGPSS